MPDAEPDSFSSTKTFIMFDEKFAGFIVYTKLAENYSGW